MFGLWVACFASLAQERTVKVPAGLSEAGLDRQMPVLAHQVLDVYRDQDQQPDLGTRFRIELVASDYAKSLDSIRSLRKLRGGTSSQAPMFVQYEIYAWAREVESSKAMPFAEAWELAFLDRFGALDDRTALQAEFAFGGNLPRMKEELDQAIAVLGRKRQVPLSQIIELIRAWQVYSAYRAFQPLVRAALAKDDSRRYAIDRNVLVPTTEGTSIATMVVRPAKAPPIPALLTFTIYANDDWAWSDAKKMAAYGYAGVVAYTRGKGRSPNAIVPFEHDGKDASAVIDWISKQEWNDGRVGMYGGSYSGYTQWAALKSRPKALRAIAASATTAPGIDVPMEGGVFLNFMYAWPSYTTSSRSLNDAAYNDNVRWSQLNRNWYASGRAYDALASIDGQPNAIFYKWLSHPDYDGYWQGMIPQGKEFADIDIPVLTTTGYFDGAQIGALHYFREHLRNRPDANHTLLIGPFEHFSMQTGVPPVVQGYDLDPSARVDLQVLRLAWFDHVFKNTPKPDLLADRVNWQVMGADTWRHAHTLEAMASHSTMFCLAPGLIGSTNVLSSQKHVEAVISQRVDFADRTDTDWRPAENVLNTTLDPHLGLAFVSDRMEQDTELAGGFNGILEFTMNKRDVDVGIGIYELNVKGEYLDLAWWLQRASYNRDRRERHLLEPGFRQQLQVNDTRLIGRRLSAGSRLVLTLGVIKQPDRQLNLGSGKLPSTEAILDAAPPLEINWYGSSCLEFGLR